jgi:enamine deaminase RidA (YjgF/YER057c/UK114 family)
MSGAAPQMSRQLHGCGEPACNGEVVAIETPYAKEVFIRCAPTLGMKPGVGFQQQARGFYGCLPRLLGQAGAEASHVVLERIFFADFARDMADFDEIRAAAYRDEGVTPDNRPAATFIQQPPCRPHQRLEVQIYAIVPKDPHLVTVETFHDAATETVAKLVDIAGLQHLYIANIQGRAAAPDDANSFRDQSDRMFDGAAALLGQYNAKFSDVVRTWCYIGDIDRDYDEFNRSRNAFFSRQEVVRLPASTGIEAQVWPTEALCGTDLYALLNPQAATIEVMTTPTLNEAPEYGSAFSRGMKVDLPDKTVLFISGTASVEESGATVHPGDPRRQMERMLRNIRGLLEPHGATFEDIVQGTTFLKNAEYLDLYQQVLEAWQIDQVPNTLVEAGVCRPDLLCEMEALVILPNRR